ncbi:unnamed protein product, partial [Ectocarpus fasciculatus]
MCQFLFLRPMTHGCIFVCYALSWIWSTPTTIGAMTIERDGMNVLGLKMHMHVGISDGDLQPWALPPVTSSFLLALWPNCLRRAGASCVKHVQHARIDVRWVWLLVASSGTRKAKPFRGKVVSHPRPWVEQLGELRGAKSSTLGSHQPRLLRESTAGTAKQNSFRQA